MEVSPDFADISQRHPFRRSRRVCDPASYLKVGPPTTISRSIRLAEATLPVERNLDACAGRTNFAVAKSAAGFSHRQRGHPGTKNGSPV